MVCITGDHCRSYEKPSAVALYCSCRRDSFITAVNMYRAIRVIWSSEAAKFATENILLGSARFLHC